MSRLMERRKRILRTGLDPHLDGINHNLRFGGEIDELMARWNRDSFGVFCRTLEVLLIRGHNAAGKRLLQQFSGWTDPNPVSLASHVADVLPIRIANALESVGLLTLVASDKATDMELLRIDQIGVGGVQVIRAACAAARAGQRLERYVLEHEASLAPDWEVDRDLAIAMGGSCTCQGVESEEVTAGTEATERRAIVAADKTDISGALAALAVLMENPTAAVAQIDSEIESLNAEIDALKRQRDLLMPPTQRKQTYVRIKSNVSDRVDIIVGALRQAGESMTPKALELATEIPYCIIGKLVKQSEGRLKAAGKHIALGE
jgi:hypothetical protein